jgi:hypothetical protein
MLFTSPSIRRRMHFLDEMLLNATYSAREPNERQLGPRLTGHLCLPSGRKGPEAVTKGLSVAFVGQRP